jgi:hypothetical protein
VTAAPFQRDQDGRLKYPVSIDIHVSGERRPRMVSCRSWDAALGYLAGQEFLEIRDRADFVTITPAGEVASGRP